MTLKHFFMIADIGKGDYIVRLKYKHDWQKDYHYSNEVVSYEMDSATWIWLNDWWEGEKDVEVLSYVAIDDITFPDRKE